MTCFVEYERILRAPVELRRVMEDGGGDFLRQDWHRVEEFRRQGVSNTMLDRKFFDFGEIHVQTYAPGDVYTTRI